MLEALRHVVWGTPNLLQRSLLSDFSHVLARSALDERFKAPVLKFLDLVSILLVAISFIILIFY